MTIRVWYESWQLECCGTPFAVNDEVTLMLVPPGDIDSLTSTVGETWARKIDFVEDHHEVTSEEPQTTRGVVRAIYASWCRFAPLPDDPSGALHPVPGTAVVESRQSAERWMTEHKGDLGFNGYIIELDRIRPMR